MKPACQKASFQGSSRRVTRKAAQTSCTACEASPWTCTCQSSEARGVKLSPPPGREPSPLQGSRSPPTTRPAPPRLSGLLWYSSAVCETVR